jgi:hypothetical protein
MPKIRLQTSENLPSYVIKKPFMDGQELICTHPSTFKIMILPSGITSFFFLRLLKVYLFQLTPNENRILLLWVDFFNDDHTHSHSWFNQIVHSFLDAELNLMVFFFPCFIWTVVFMHSGALLTFDHKSCKANNYLVLF